MAVRLTEADVELLRSRPEGTRSLSAALVGLIDELIQDVRTARVRFSLSRLRAEAHRRQEAGQDPEAARRWLFRRCRAIARRAFEPAECGWGRAVRDPQPASRTRSGRCPRVTIALDGQRAAFVRTRPGRPAEAVRGLLEWAHGRAAFTRLFDAESALRSEARMLRYAGYDEQTITMRQSWRWASLRGRRTPNSRARSADRSTVAARRPAARRRPP